jgi:hypothetical protein
MNKKQLVNALRSPDGGETDLAHPVASLATWLRWESLGEASPG